VKSTPRLRQGYHTQQGQALDFFFEEEYNIFVKK
jgi:hypothetical protein